MELVSRVDTLLHNTATMLVARDFHVEPGHLFVNELFVRDRPAGQNLLDHMVSVDILREWVNMGGQVRAKQAGVLLFPDDFDDLLDRAGPVHVAAKLHWVVLDLLDYLDKLGV